jgi:cytochrome P450
LVELGVAERVMRTPSGVIAAVDYPAVGGNEDPYPLYARLREQALVYELSERPGIYLISRYADVRGSLARPTVFQNKGSRAGLNPFELLIDTPSSATVMTDEDGSIHKSKRQLAFQPIKPGRLEAYKVRIVEIVDALLDEFLADGCAEFSTQFAKQVPLRMTLWLMGVPDEDVEWVRLWATLEGVGLSWLPETDVAQQKRNAARMSEYLTAKLGQRSEQPGTDVMSLMIHAQSERDGHFDLDEVRAQTAALLGGGIISTGHAMTSAMMLLLINPGQMALVRADPRRIPSMVEEALRVESPNQWVPRKVAVDTDVAGVRLPAGSFALLLQGSANRDPAKFDEPERFDIARPNATEHVAFAYGPHFCLGAPLARLELTVAFERLIARLEEIRLSGENDFRHISSPSFRGLRALNIEFTAKR